MDLDQALDTFDRVETNLGRLEGVWKELEALVPEGIKFPNGSAEHLKYEDLARAFDDLANGLPPIDGVWVQARPLDLEFIAQHRLDAVEISEIEISIRLGREMNEPAEEIADYRHRFAKERRGLVRKRVEGILVEIDELLDNAAAHDIPEGQSMLMDEDWIKLSSDLAEIQRLLGDDLVKKGRWGDLARHLSFAKGVDLKDIALVDWPSIRPDIEASLYGDLDPLPVDAVDLAAITASQPEGPVATKLNWSTLSDEDFERLLFDLLEGAEGYENVEWLQHTNAPDRGRDLSAVRVFTDSLAGTRRERVVIQCKHWLSKSVNPDHCVGALSRAVLWKPPFDVLVIATSGRFTTDGIQWIDQHNEKGERPMIERWAETRLESLLAGRTALITKFELRS